MKTHTSYAAPGTRVPPLLFDEDGFLQDPHSWTRAAARGIAELDGIGDLGPDHWAILFYLREHHLTYGSLPPMSQVCRTHGLDRGAVKRLFGGCREAWRIAGLPNPGSEALSYMEAVSEDLDPDACTNSHLETELHQLLREYPQWRIQGRRLHRDYRFADFRHALAFMNAVADEAERLNHHPDWSNSYDRVSVDLYSHEADAITHEDILLARRMEVLAGA